MCPVPGEDAPAVGVEQPARLQVATNREQAIGLAFRQLGVWEGCLGIGSVEQIQQRSAQVTSFL